MVLFMCSLIPAASAQALLQITNPSNLTLYQEGQTYTITVSADPSLSNIFVTPESPLPAAQATSNPLQFNLMLPTNIDPGIYSIGAVGFTPSSDVEAAPVQVDVERVDTPISMSVNPAIMTFSTGDTRIIDVQGTFSDGSTLRLTNSTLPGAPLLDSHSNPC